jgi:protein-glutamine gamma-glutamyltransferase
MAIGYPCTCEIFLSAGILRKIEIVAAIAQIARPPASVAEKFFQGSLYLLLVMGFCALAGTARLDALSIILVAVALLVRGYHLLRGRTILIPDRWTNLLTVAYFAFYAADYFLLTQSFVSATVHLVLFIMVIKIFSVQRDRDLLYLAVLSFLMVLAAAVLTADTVFLFTFCLFMLTAMATFVSMEMRRSEREARIIAISPASENKFNRSLYAVAGLLAVSTVAVGVVIFFVLPRMAMGGYLQSVGAQTDFVTGFSDSVNLGGIGKIQQSNTPVMHVQVLHGFLPPDVKWRGLSLSDFDGHRWSNPSPELSVVVPMHNVPVDLRPLRLNNTPVYSLAHKETLGYRVILEPIGSYVFFLASTPTEVNGPYSEVSVAASGSVSKSEGARSIDVYEGEADTTDATPLVQNSNSQNYPFDVRIRYLSLPPRLDRRIPALARSITSAASSNYARAKAIETYLRRNLGYTLELPGNEADPLAHFLFERKQGHCEYFASSMAIMLRTLKIPARVVNGFRGAEYNDINQTYIVRARDAHSWVEVYFPENGWTTFDPTPALSASAGSDASSRLALYLDALHEMWREWIINYDFNRQLKLGAQISTGATRLQGAMHLWYLRKYRQILARIGHMSGTVSSGNMFVICALGLLVMALPFAPRALRAFRKTRLLKNPRSAPRSSASLWYARMLKTMARRGVHKAPTQTAAEFALAIHDPGVRRNVIVFTEHYERARFGGSAEDAMRLPELYEQLQATLS